MLATETTAPPLDLAVRLGCELLYHAPARASALFLFKPSHGPMQFIREERTYFEPGLTIEEFRDEHENLVFRTVLEPGRNFLRYDAIVRISSLPDDRLWVDGPMSIDRLPASVIRYLLPSRYVDSDTLVDLAWQAFSSVPDGLARVHAICEWTRRELAYQTGSGDASLSAGDVLRRGYGVCRDFAHVAVALCRAMSIPARYVSGHLPDIGVPARDPDFHAYFEAYLAGRWQRFDARFEEPQIGRVDIACGLDASQCAFATVFGGAILQRFEVWCYQVDHRAVTTADPVDLSQRLDGTPRLRRPR